MVPEALRTRWGPLRSPQASWDLAQWQQRVIWMSGQGPASSSDGFHGGPVRAATQEASGGVPPSRVISEARRLVPHRFHGKRFPTHRGAAGCTPEVPTQEAACELREGSRSGGCASWKPSGPTLLDSGRPELGLPEACRLLTPRGLSKPSMGGSQTRRQAGAQEPGPGCTCSLHARAQPATHRGRRDMSLSSQPAPTPQPGPEPSLWAPGPTWMPGSAGLDPEVSAGPRE